MTKRRNNYKAPAVLGIVPASVECDLLAASVVDNTTQVTTAGQDVNNVYDAQSDEFNHKWW